MTTSESRVVREGPTPRSVRTTDGRVLEVPSDWSLLPPGDAGLTRRVKAAGPTWTVEEKVGRRTFSRGVWASTASIEVARAALETERADPAYAKKLEKSRARRDREQASYVEDFRGSVRAFLRFHPRYATMEGELAERVTTHATPVGSGTVARTERIPIEERAEAAVIAWMRHQTTAYDDMAIARIRGERRRVRRELAERSRVILEAYRRGLTLDPSTCPLARALEKTAVDVVAPGPSID
ncbi:MAG: DUF2293 domain-containing protein [Sandaracinus sp.]